MKIQKWVAIAALTATMVGLSVPAGELGGIARGQGRVYDLRPFFRNDAPPSPVPPPPQPPGQAPIQAPVQAPNPVPIPVPTPVQQSRGGNFSLRELEANVQREVNTYRALRGLSPLVADETIAAVARRHSEAMAAGRVQFSHDGFEERAEALQRSLPYRSVAENLALNRGAPEPDARALAGWLESSGHQQNIVGDFDMTGVGVAQAPDGSYYFTQLFLKRR